jgi:general secretion pathway protein D
MIDVRDRDTVAMGGLMRDKISESLNKVPLLGDIPVLGWLFKQKTKDVRKLNMLFFMTPKIMDSYQNSTASTVKDLINRRGAHLKNSMGEDDPFQSTAKGIYDKASKQQEGPLYDPHEGSRFIRANEGPGIGAVDVPEYKKIAEEVKAIKSAPKRSEALDLENLEIKVQQKKE